MASYEVKHGLPARRVVITGMGIVAPNGCELPVFWDSIVKGESAAKPITRFETRDLPTKIGCEVTNFEPKNYMDFKKARRFDLSVQFGVAAAVMAAKDSGLNPSSFDPDRMAVIEGTSVSSMECAFNGQTAYLTKGYTKMSPFLLLNAYCGAGSGEIALELGVKGHAITMSTGSASGNDTIGLGMRMVREGEVDVAIAGGAEAPILAPIYAGFCHARVMTTRNSEPKSSMRPLDKGRDGFLLGEGSGYVVLEELSHALARGAKIYAEVAGHGRSCEAYHSVNPHPDGIGMIRAMEKALHMSQMHAAEINYINIHGTATLANDVAEMKAIRTLFNGHSAKVAVSSTKPVTGHLLAAAGAMETIICALSLKNAVIPHTINLTDIEAGCEGNLVVGSSRSYPIETVMNLNSGFGGKNSCLILKKFVGKT